MKVILNSSDTPNTSYREIRISEIEEIIFSQKPDFVCNLGYVDLYRGRNKENSKLVVKLVDRSDETNVRLIEFDKIIDMFHFIDSLSIFNKYNYLFIQP